MDLKDRIDRLGLYPITVSTLLTNREKQFLLSRDVVLCRQLINDEFLFRSFGNFRNEKRENFKRNKQLFAILKKTNDGKFCKN